MRRLHKDYDTHQVCLMTRVPSGNSTMRAATILGTCMLLSASGSVCMTKARNPRGHKSLLSWGYGSVGRILA